jgi:hypothetical protein
MLSRPQGHSATGRIISMKNSSDTVGNRTHDLPVCSAVPQPPRHRVPHPSYIENRNFCNSSCTFSCSLHEPSSITDYSVIREVPLCFACDASLKQSKISAFKRHLSTDHFSHYQKHSTTKQATSSDQEEIVQSPWNKILHNSRRLKKGEKKIKSSPCNMTRRQGYWGEGTSSALPSPNLGAQRAVGQCDTSTELTLWRLTATIVAVPHR